MRNKAVFGEKAFEARRRRVRRFARECLDAVQADKGQGGACEALDFLARKMECTKEGLIAYFALTALKGKGEVTPSVLPPGVSGPKELLKHEKRIREIAESIGKLNAEEYWYAGYPCTMAFEDKDIRREPGREKGVWLLRPRRRAFKEARKAFESLPRTLEMYARNLGGKARDELYWRGVQRMQRVGQHWAEADLLEYIQHRTGHKYLEKVASILRVIYPMAGLPPIEGDSLRKRAYRKRRPA